MNFDRNTIIGFIALAILFIGYFYYTSSEQKAFQRQKARQDSIARASSPKPDPVALSRDSIQADSIRQTATQTPFTAAGNGTENLTIVENNLFRVAFSNKGAQPKWVELKHFKGPDSTQVKLAASNRNRIDYLINAGSNQTAGIASLFFTGGTVAKNADGSQTLSYELKSPTGGAIVHQFVVRADEYMIDFNIRVDGVPQLLGNSLNLNWENEARQQQRDLDYERGQSSISYVAEGDYDDYLIADRSNKELDNSVNWVAIKQQFFNTTLVARKGNFSSALIEWTMPPAGTGSVVQARTALRMPLPASPDVTIPLGLYYGPNDYKTLKAYGNDMENMVNLGSGIFAFVKYINRWIILPVWELFTKITANYGIVILLLTLFIRLLISPLTYSSYLSGAKMKVLRPEIQKLREKYGNDQQQISMEQMKLFREAGVNPLGGCIPALLQIPIFFALFSFFNSNVDLRGNGFLWAEDLAQYDSVASLPFEIPFYGDHVSLFTITAVITSLLISLYSMSMTPDQGNPVLKYMPYIFPFVLLFIFNSQPSALTWYYTVSNIITLVLQFVIQNYIINHDKILAKMEENRKKPKTKTKWQERFEQMQEQQKKMQEMQRKGK